MINWKIRFNNKYFWFALISAVLLILQIVLGWFGYDLPIESLGAEAEKALNAIFSLLVILGIVNDHSVAGLSDSKQVMKREKPREDDHYIR